MAKITRKYAVPVFDEQGAAYFHCFKLLKNGNLGKLIEIVPVKDHGKHFRGFEYGVSPLENNEGKV